MAKHTIPVPDSYVLSKEAVANINLVKQRVNDATAALTLHDRIVLAGMLDSALQFATPAAPERAIVQVHEASGELSQLMLAPAGMTLLSALQQCEATVQRVKQEKPNEYEWQDIANALMQQGWDEPTWGVCDQVW